MTGDRAQLLGPVGGGGVFSGEALILGELLGIH